MIVKARFTSRLSTAGVSRIWSNRTTSNWPSLISDNFITKWPSRGLTLLLCEVQSLCKLSDSLQTLISLYHTHINTPLCSHGRQTRYVHATTTAAVLFLLCQTCGGTLEKVLLVEQCELGLWSPRMDFYESWSPDGNVLITWVLSAFTFWYMLSISQGLYKSDLGFDRWFLFMCWVGR